MEQLNCLIIDDEEGAHLVLEYYLKDLSRIKLQGSFYNAIEAMEYIYSHQIDLIFLDINMPGLSGMEMLAAMTNPPLVVLTTAYAEYALESYKYQVVDYLVKPIQFPNFVAALDKVFSRLGKFSTVVDKKLVNSSAPDFLMLRVEGDTIRVVLNEISYIQSWGNYVKINANKKTFLSQITTVEIENRLDRAKFRRIHKSYIVALDRIKKITGGQIFLDDEIILPLGNTYKRELLEYFHL